VHNIVLSSRYGTITIRPRPDISPVTVAMVTSLAAHPDDDYGSFIRHEPVPEVGPSGFACGALLRGRQPGGHQRACQSLCLLLLSAQQNTCHPTYPLPRLPTNPKPRPITKRQPHAPPQNWGANGFRGPPYALLGGTLRSLERQTPTEGTPVLERGDVAMIPGSMDFFIALADHPEWGHSHTVWGKVRGWGGWLGARLVCV